ncbi:hypothetical protein PproGo58_45230 [Pseudomonas protegens]|nr:hypothetical protein PproGo58_45230 [Pseudomonas protegens]
MLSIGTPGNQDLAAGIPDDGRSHMYSFHRTVSSDQALGLALTDQALRCALRRQAGSHSGWSSVAGEVLKCGIPR